MVKNVANSKKPFWKCELYHCLRLGERWVGYDGLSLEEGKGCMNTHAHWMTLVNEACVVSRRQLAFQYLESVTATRNMSHGTKCICWFKFDVIKKCHKNLTLSVNIIILQSTYTIVLHILKYLWRTQLFEALRALLDMRWTNWS